MSRDGKRRKWTASDKLRIVLAGMQPGVNVSDLCRGEGVPPALYYAWKKRLLNSVDRIFETPFAKEDDADRLLEAETQRLTDVIAEITAENLDLKKALDLEDHGKHPLKFLK